MAAYKSGASKSRPRWAAHTRIGNAWEYPPPLPGLHPSVQMGASKFNAGKWRTLRCTAEPRFNEPLFNENLVISNGILCPGNNKIYDKEPRYNEP